MNNRWIVGMLGGLIIHFIAEGQTPPPSNAAQAAPAKPSTAPERANANASATPAATASAASTMIYRRQWEPKERAFSFLQPKDWQLTGGILNVNPLTAGGPANSMVPKCDLTVQREAAGRVYFRWLPSWNHCDYSFSPTAGLMANMFPVGANYQGMPVRPLPTWDRFLLEGLTKLHPRAQNVRVLEQKEIPELMEIYKHLNREVDAVVRGLGARPMTYQAGALEVEYEEDGVKYRQGLVTALVDNRGGAFMWSNEYTLAMRAPAAEAEMWRPVFHVIRRSLQFNPEWVARVAQAARERGKLVEETMRYLQRVDREIYEHRAKTNAEIRHENYLTLTGQEEYVNPYTQEVELDTNDYKYRWTTEGGDRIYSHDRNFDPNQIRELNNVEWKTTPVRPR